MKAKTMKIETYNLKSKNGRHIRKATKITLDDGTVVRFLEKLTKAEIVKFVQGN